MLLQIKSDRVYWCVAAKLNCGGLWTCQMTLRKQDLRNARVRLGNSKIIALLSRRWNTALILGTRTTNRSMISVCSGLRQ